MRTLDLSATAQRPYREGSPPQRYLAAVRQRWALILLITLLTVAAAALYVTLAPKVYEGEALVLVTPIGRDDETYTGLGLIRETADPTRDVETAALLIENGSVAERVNAMLRLQASPQETLARVSVEPIAQSNLVSVRAQGPTAGRARDLANAFATAAIERRTERLRVQVDDAITRLRTRIAAVPEGDAEARGLEERLSTLSDIRDRPDPTLRLELPAVAPTAAISPRPRLALMAGLIAGLGLGIATALALAGIDPRLRREEQLHDLAPWPILARVPTSRTRGRELPMTPLGLTPPAAEAYRTLAARLLQIHGSEHSAQRPLSVLVTSALSGEGKSTTALNLAFALATPDRRVLLVEAELRRPTLGPALGLQASAGARAVFSGEIPLHEALIPVPSSDGRLSVLLAGSATGEGWRPEWLSLSAADRFLSEAESVADVIVIDSPPLTTVADALPFTHVVDQVLLPARIGRSRLSRLRQLRDVLNEHGVNHVGWLLNGAPTTPEDDDYHYVDRSRRNSRATTPNGATGVAARRR